MSDDVPLIIAHPAGQRRVAFASAASESQMRQYAAAGWIVGVLGSFQAARPIDLAKVPAQTIPPNEIGLADVLSIEAAHAPAGLAELRSVWPAIVKVNLAFNDAADALGPSTAESLANAGYAVLGAHWRDDNSYRIDSLSRIEMLAALQPPEWPRMNLIACRDVAMAEAIIRIGRVHAGQERRIADLRVGEAVRNDHIARLEDAVQTLQARLAAK